MHQLGAQFNEDLQQAAGTIQSAPPAMPVPAAAGHPTPHIVIQTWRPSDGALPGHTSDPTVLLPRARHGFSTVTGANGRIWDVFALEAGNTFVQMAEQRAVRSDNAWRVAMWAAIPVLVLLPLLVWVIRASVRMSLRPLGEIGERVAQADLNHLQPVPIDSAPQELRPFLESINRMMLRLSTLIESERTFIADAAHELRSPITALQLQVDNLRHAPPGTAEERLHDLHRGVRRTSTLVNQLLGLARAEIGASAAPAMISLPQVVTDVVADLLPLALDRGVDLGAEQLDDATVRAQETDMRMLVKNLIDNAIRYGGEGSRVDVSVRRHDGQVEIEVADALGLQPFRHVDTRVVAQLVDQGAGVGVHRDRIPMRARQESGDDHMVDEMQKCIEEPVGVQQADRLVDLHELVHGPDHHQLLDRADTAGQGDEGIGEVDHALLAVAQRRGDLVPGEAGMRLSALMQALGDHAMHIAAGSQCRIGDHAHESLRGAAIDDCHAGFPQRLTQRACAGRERVGGTMIGATKYGNGLDGANRHVQSARSSEAGNPKEFLAGAVVPRTGLRIGPSTALQAFFCGRNGMINFSKCEIWIGPWLPRKPASSRRWIRRQPRLFTGRSTIDCARPSIPAY